MTKNILIPISLISLISLTSTIGCSKDPKDSDRTPHEDEIVEKARVSGTVSDEGTALEGEGMLSSATEARVVSVDEGGDRVVHGSGSVDAQGRFAIEAEGMTRTFLVEVLDAQGQLVGAGIASAESTADEDVSVGEITRETTIEAMVWAEVVNESGFQTLSSSEVQARVDASTSTAAHAWYDMHEDGEALFVWLADSLVLAAYTRADAAAEAGLVIDADVYSRILGHVESASTSSELALGLDVAFSAEGMSAMDRSALVARVESSFRAGVEAILDRSETEGSALIVATQDSSAQLEARAHAEAWGLIATGAEGGGDLAVELHSTLEAGADASERGEAGIEDLQVQADAMIQSTIDALVLGDVNGGLIVELGLETDIDSLSVTEALRMMIVDLRSDLSVGLVADADAEAGSNGLDAMAVADAHAMTWADVGTELDRLAQAAEASAESRAALHLATTAFVNAER